MVRSLASYHPKGTVSIGNTALIVSNADFALKVCNSGDYPLEARPELLRLSMRVISAWSIIDSYIARCFTTIVGNEKAAVAIYGSLNYTRAKHSALAAAARAQLPKTHQTILDVLLWNYNQRVDFRNQVAHNLWGFTSAAPNGIALISPANLTELQSSPNQEVWTRISVYEEADFTAAVTKAEDMGRWFHLFYFLVLGNLPIDQALPMLLGVPRLHERLNPAPSSGQNNPPVPP